MDQIPKEKHDHQALIFPKGFLWGAATSAHQVEGNNFYNDWWNFEVNQQPPNLRSGQASNQYRLFKKDFELAKKLSHNSHRLSIEWSRIEPTEGQFNQEAIDHYQEVLQELKDCHMKVMLTLWHFTLPKWIADQGGWENGQTIDYFTRFVAKIVPEFKDLVDFWITLNEPDIYVFMAYLGGDEAGRWPPAKKNRLTAFKVVWNLAEAHKKAYKIIHQNISDTQVGIANNLQSYEPYHKHSLIEQLIVSFSDLIGNHTFYFLTKGAHDFFGVNYYFHHRYQPSFSSYLPQIVDVKDQSRDVSDLGWEIYPEGIFDVLTDLADDIPIYITECGIASTNDDRRTRFLIQYLQEIYRAIEAGVNVKGFFYWSLIDNFEWHRGFEPRFGLIEVDYKTQQRHVRTSAYVYQEIIKHNSIPHKLLKLLGHTLNVKKELEEIITKDGRAMLH